MAGRGVRSKVVKINESNRKAPAWDKPGTTDETRLEYMAELLLELKDMARRGGYGTLSGILEVAYQEALAKTREQRQAH